MGASCKNQTRANQRCSEGEETSAQRWTFPRWRFIFKITSKWKNARVKPAEKGVCVCACERERERGHGQQQQEGLSESDRLCFPL